MSKKAQETSPVWIYALLDPETDEPRYVGKAIDPHRRYAQHLSERQYRTHKQFWIASLRRRGLQPRLELLQLVPASEWAAAERHYIAQYRTLGARLTNGDDGGYGGKSGPEDRVRYLKRMLSKAYRDLVKLGQVEAAARVALKLRAAYVAHPHFMPATWQAIGL